MEVYMDDKWKLSKKGSRKELNSPPTKGGKERSRSMARSISSRCAGLVREQRARFYIMRRCVTMLVCWREYA